MYVQTKALIQSRTFWFTALKALAGVLIVFQTTYPGVGWIVLSESAISFLLRLYTSGPITGVVNP